MLLNNRETNNAVHSSISSDEGSLQNADVFKQELIDLIDSGAKNVVLSFENVTYVDSSFLGSLVAGLKYALAKGADICLVDLQPDILDLLKLIRMDKVFKIYKNYDEAINKK